MRQYLQVVLEANSRDIFPEGRAPRCCPTNSPAGLGVRAGSRLCNPSVTNLGNSVRCGPFSSVGNIVCYICMLTSSLGGFAQTQKRPHQPIERMGAHVVVSFKHISSAYVLAQLARKRCGSAHELKLFNLCTRDPVLLNIR